MPKTIYVDGHDDTGHDAASGLDKKRPKRTLQAAQAIAKAGDTVLVRQDSVFTMPQVITTSGVTYDVYSLGTEGGQPPTIRLPRGGTAKLTGLLIQGSDNRVLGWDVDGADIGVDLASSSADRKVLYRGNEIEDVRVRRYAWAVRIRANGTTLRKVSTFQGRMYRDGDITATGANAFTLWGDEGLTLRDVTLENCYSEDAWAYSTGLTEKPDGSTVEAWGNIDGVTIHGMVSRYSGTFFEAGGRVRLASGAPANEAARNILFSKCLVIDPMGRVCYINDRKGKFPIEIENIQFVESTLKANDDKTSAFFVGADHESLAEKIHVHGCVVVGAAQFYNAGPNTSIESVDHTDNHYVRSDGGRGIGVRLHASETFSNTGMPFYAPDYDDYRLSVGHPRAVSLGALGAAQAPYRGSGTTELPYGVGRVRGGYDSAVNWLSLTRVAGEDREVGMERYVHDHRQVYRLGKDKKTWLKV